MTSVRTGKRQLVHLPFDDGNSEGGGSILWVFLERPPPPKASANRDLISTTGCPGISRLVPARGLVKTLDEVEEEM